MKVAESALQLAVEQGIRVRLIAAAGAS